MKVRKIISKTEDRELNITGVTLLSFEEFRTYEDNIQILNNSWWLRSPGDCILGAPFVSRGGYGYSGEYGVSDSSVGVRPVLQISNLGDLEVGDKFNLADRTWTIMSNDCALCDSCIGTCAFREDWKAKDAIDYEVSDVKKFVENWYQENI